MGPGRDVAADLRLDPPADHGLVARVTDRVEGLGQAGRVELDPAVGLPPVADQRHRGAGVPEVLESLLVLARVEPGGGGGGQAGRVLHSLDQEAVTVIRTDELVDQTALGSAPPGRHLGAIGTEHRGRGMEPEVAARGRPADPGAQQHPAALQRARGNHDLRGPNRQLGAAGGRAAGDPGGPSAVDQHPLDEAPGDDLGPGLEGVAQIRLHRGLLGPGLVAEAHVAGAGRVIAPPVGVAGDGLERPAQRLRAPLEHQVRLVEVGALVVDRQA